MRKRPIMIRSTYPEGLYHRDDLHLSMQQMDAEISRLLRENHGVGILGGYYEPGLPLALVSELALQILGYDSIEAFQETTGGCMAALLPENGYTEEAFSALDGPAVIQVQGRCGPLWVRLVKENRLQLGGEPLWLASVCDMDALHRKEREILQITEEKRRHDVEQQTALERKNRELEAQKQELERSLEELQRSSEIISAISKIYWLLYRLDLESGTFEEISVGGDTHRLTGDRGYTAQRFPAACRQTVAKEYQEAALAFLDTSTLAERLKDRDDISQEYMTHTGNWHMGRFIVQKRNEQGRVVKVLYTIQVINEQKRQELEYEQRLARIAEEAQRANLSKSDFLRRMSHDIRTPINGIRGMIEIAEHCADDPEKQAQCRGKVWEASGYLLSLVNSVLDMNKLESGSVILANDPFDLPQLLDEVNAVAEMQAMEHGLHYACDRSRRHILHPHLIGSVPHLKQVLMNLASNAVKYNRPGGSVTVWCEELRCDGETAVFRFACTDTGIGISPDFQEHVFEPFAQEGRNDARTHYDGSGLGLSIAKALVQQMGGTIDFTSQVGVGTSFYVTLPLKVDHAPHAPVETEAAAPSDLTGIRVLLVEDNALNLEIAQFFLQQHGADVTVARNGQEAVEQFAASAPGGFDVILMDVMMPVMNGYEATQAIRAMERPDAKTVPILAMSANAFQDDIRRSREMGMNEHLAKPLSTEKLIAAICRHVRRK